MTIGENLKKARTTKGISQALLAEKVEAGKSTYIGWEHDTNPPPADKLMLLAKELDVSVDALLFGEESGLSAELKDIFRRFDALPAPTKGQAKLLLRALLFSLETNTHQEDNAA